MIHKYEPKRLELEASGAAAHITGAHDARMKTLKLPPFSDDHDKLDSYLQRLSGSRGVVRGKKTNRQRT